MALGKEIIGLAICDETRLRRTWGQVSTFNKPGFPPNFSHSFLKFFILKWEAAPFA
jgi:hypothetical protein